MGVKNIYPLVGMVSRKEQEKFLNQKGKVFWFTGLSGSGKSTIALAFEKELYTCGYYVKTLDGDNIRTGINRDLGFTQEERKENIRRIAEVAKLFVDSGAIVLCSFISPTIAIRKHAREIIGNEDFLEIFIDTPLEICEERDVKGLYRKARAGEIKGFTGIDSPYEIPENPDVILDTTNLSVDQSVEVLVNLVREF